MLLTIVSHGLSSNRFPDRPYQQRSRRDFDENHGARHRPLSAAGFVADGRADAVESTGSSDRHSERAETGAGKRSESALCLYQHRDPGVAQMIKQADRLSSILLRLANDKKEDKKRELSISQDFAYAKPAVPSRMIMPLQDALTCTLPSTSDTVKSHNPFPLPPVEIHGGFGGRDWLKSAFSDTVEVMPSLQKPKKLVFIGTDGRHYPFLCKPHDDLRKDARLMDFNSMINKLLNSASESRRRQLCP